VIRSSISNSEGARERRFWRRAAAAFVVALAGYSAVVAVVPVKPTTFVTQDARNAAMAESFVLGPRPKIVLAGSSLCARLDAELLGKEVGNICFAGGSALTGLDLIEAVSAYPDIVLIEANFFYRRADPAFVAQATRPVSSWLKGRFPALQVANEPINLLLSGLKSLSPGAQRPDPIAIRRAIEQRLSDVSERPSDGDLAAATALLARHVDRLLSHNVRIAVLEMPVADELEDVDATRRPIEALARLFPPGEVPWFRWDRTSAVETTDGAHLTDDSAAKVASRVAHFIASLEAEPRSAAPLQRLTRALDRTAGAAASTPGP